MNWKQGCNAAGQLKAKLFKGEITYDEYARGIERLLNS